MGFEHFIAMKQLNKRRKTGFISLISMISVCGVAVGVMALIVVLSVMTGFDKEFKAKIVNVQPHLRIERIGGIQKPEDQIKIIEQSGMRGLKSAAAFVEGQGIVRSRYNATGTIVKGLDVEREDMDVYRRHMVSGELDLSPVTYEVKKRFLLFFKRTEEKAMGSILLGESLAARLHVRVGDQVNVISPFQEKGNEDALGGKAESRPFVVKGLFRVGKSDFDSTLVIVSLNQAQGLYHLGDRVSGISLRFSDVDQAEAWKYALRDQLGPGFYLRTWYDMNETFFQALKVEKSMLTILLALIILVAAFNIVSTLIMIVMEKTKDIGILRALGATRGSIRKIFLIEGFSVGIMGVMGGTVAGLLIAFNLNPISDFIKQTTGFELFPSDIYYFDKIPAQVELPDVFVIVAFAMLASILAGLYPANRAARLHPIEALRYE